MANTQTIAQLPYNVDDVDSLKRFLRELVDNLDEVLGYKGDKKYVQDSDFKAQGLTLNELTDQTKENTDTLDNATKLADDQADQILDMQGQIILLNTVLTAKQVDSVYYDFNNAAWNTLQGRFEFQTLGSNLVNPPMAVVPGNTYNVYIDSTKTNNSVWQYVLLDSGGLNVYMRVGVNSSWVKLNN